MALMLVHEPPRPERPDEPEGPRRRPHIPLEPFLWLAAVAWCLVLVGLVGGFAGYLLLLAMIVAGCRRLSRWSEGHVWDGMRQHRQ